ncbi:MAG: hypothetical protein A2898_04965 [Candidatus Kerfeldbacteria bacterium RIFCSPLOWO2_01_FULL_48_11]|uniref:Dephospho-CoA kinase n=1 Tax=Candidatus Kerfeldbacteria bacterium RIFCSPLOWO2_01_FULL_48_11 TaxID=1798543 RepID=A0A1G2B136_9BACT|nr:MAG: hypothetical protein UY34_C0006G0065 [Parcubacteria group bacterium GW2011_GWA2_48_9]KKW15662.1 MAG: hypothetical protein UY52_C0016G0039 [Parcubacteria group bacterium GW2011_GWC2_49_9]OGY82903.1 MAG: hypothetical protein A2898_04965 [Candidatus Kerfeldbacteria bacterium RIFCSPLOWO2_01_FULL_48_11]HCJ52846.1 hypothetical protein [Candidatus Kerfeldbacteria bacterium]HCM68073.1 hypothetical protein [Candidatus Kerfeldbacteria bacterium]
MIIGLTGLPAAGKGTIVKYLVEKYQARQIRFSDPLRDMIHRVYQEQTRESMSHFGTFVRKEFGEDILVKTLLHDIEKMEGSLFVLDGMRFLNEFDTLSREAEFSMWAVDTELSKRYERIVKRGENTSDNTLSREQFEKQHELPTEVHIPTLMDKAHARINNNGTFEQLYAQVDLLMKGMAR